MGKWNPCLQFINMISRTEGIDNVKDRVEGGGFMPSGHQQLNLVEVRRLIVYKDGKWVPIG